MKEMSRIDRFHAAMMKKEVDRPPVCGMTTTATVEMMDACGAAWPEAHVDADKMARLAMEAFDFLGLESMRVPYCLTYEVEALGGYIDLGKKNSTPMVKGGPFREDVDAPMELPSEDELLSLARNGIIKEAAEIIVKQSEQRDLPTVLGVTGPFTIAGHLVGAESLLLSVITEPDYAHKVTKFATDYVKMWLREVDGWGVDTIQMSEPTASWDMLSPDMFKDFALPNLQESFKVMDHTMQVLHICGNMLPMIEEMAASGATGLSVEEKTDPFEAVKRVGDKSALVGNVGIVKPLLQGSPEDVRSSTQRSVDAGFDIISAACGMSALIKRENVLAMTDLVRSMSK